MMRIIHSRIISGNVSGLYYVAPDGAFFILKLKIDLALCLDAKSIFLFLEKLQTVWV